jgi:hypothetical protein
MLSRYRSLADAHSEQLRRRLFQVYSPLVRHQKGNRPDAGAGGLVSYALERTSITTGALAVSDSSDCKNVMTNSLTHSSTARTSPALQALSWRSSGRVGGARAIIRGLAVAAYANSLSRVLRLLMCPALQLNISLTIRRNGSGIDVRVVRQPQKTRHLSLRRAPSAKHRRKLGMIRQRSRCVPTLG